MVLHKLLPSRQVIIFGIVGIINTSVDFITYVLLLHSTHSIVFSNVAATSIGLGVSYVLNKRYTFKQDKMTRRKILLFLVVTLSGLWVIQTFVIYVLTPVVANLPHAAFSWLGVLSGTASTLLPKLLATGVSLIWNYLWYSRVIFVDNNKRNKAINL